LSPLITIRLPSAHFVYYSFFKFFKGLSIFNFRKNIRYFILLPEALNSEDWKDFKQNSGIIPKNRNIQSKIRFNPVQQAPFLSNVRQDVFSAGSSAMVPNVPVRSGIWNAPIPEGALMLAQKIPGLLNAAFAPNTLSKYGRAWSKFTLWCTSMRVNDVCPASHMTVALYYVHVLDTMKTRGALTDAKHAINWAHNLADCKSPTKSKFVQKVLEGAKRKCKKLNKQKDPIYAEDTKELFSLTDMASSSDLRFLLTVVLAFAGFMRICEFLSVQIKHIEFKGEYIKILLPGSKTDQCREGHHLYIARTGNPTCPVKLLETFLDLTGLGSSQENFLAGRLIRSKGGYRVCGLRPISYSRMRTIILEGLRPLMLKYPERKFGTHSLRIGGTTAASAGGISGRLLSQHGRWKTASCRNRYIVDPVKKRLSVTRALGI